MRPSIAIYGTPTVAFVDTTANVAVAGSVVFPTFCSNVPIARCLIAVYAGDPLNGEIYAPAAAHSLF